MPNHDGSKEICFTMWKAGKSLKEIQRNTTALPETAKRWVQDWERGQQRVWRAKIKWG